MDATSTLIQTVITATSITAIWFAWRESRRNNSVVLRVVESGFSSRTNVNPPYKRSIYKLAIKNCGLPLHGVQIALRFSFPDNKGFATVVLQRFRGSVGGADCFSKGMIGEFGFEVAALTDQNKVFLSSLSDPRKQGARFSVFSQGYLVAELKLFDWKDRLRQR